MSNYIDNILENSEHKKWEGKINRAVMAVGLIIGLIIIGGISGYFFSKDTISYTSNGVPSQIKGFYIGLPVLILGLLIVIIGFLSNLVVEYAITNKRIIIKSGLIGTDYKSIYFEQISGVVVDVGIIGKIFGTGNLKIDTGKTETYSSGGRQGNRGNIRTRTMYETLKNIDIPYDVYKLIQPSITGRRESLYSGRADRESNPQNYK